MVKGIVWVSRSEERRVGREWSSDVCSSDLPVGGIRLHRLDENRVARLRLMYRAIAAGGHGEGHRVGVEIGRASCRERVEFRRVLFRSTSRWYSAASAG